MKGLVGRLEDVFTAVAFAEAGEHEKAREFLAGLSASVRAKIHIEIHPQPHMPLVPEGDS